MVVEARKLVDNHSLDDGAENGDDGELTAASKAALNALGYEEAAQHVYGMAYGRWKARHQKKATDEQLKRYKASEPLQAKHDKQLLATRGERPAAPLLRDAAAVETPGQGDSGIMSNVCCQDAEEVAAAAATTTSVAAAAAADAANESHPSSKNPRTVGPYRPPPLPRLDKSVRVAVLTVSDRAFRREYAAGDLSGPAVQTAVRLVMKTAPTLGAATASTTQVTLLPTAIVPDETTAIQQQLLAWSHEKEAADIILTTGGTGMSPRDVTPEATRAVLETECAGLMNFVATECSRLQPLASLTRGTAGILAGGGGKDSSSNNKSLVANLPGNPKAVGEIMPILLPLLLHALQDLRA